MRLKEESLMFAVDDGQRQVVLVSGTQCAESCLPVVVVVVEYGDCLIQLIDYLRVRPAIMHMGLYSKYPHS